MSDESLIEWITSEANRIRAEQVARDKLNQDPWYRRSVECGSELPRIGFLCVEDKEHAGPHRTKQLAHTITWEPFDV